MTERHHDVHPDFEAVQTALSGVSMILQLNEDLIRSCLRACERVEAVGPVLIPTEYRDGAARADRNARIFRASLEYLDTLRKIKAEVEGSDPNA